MRTFEYMDAVKQRLDIASDYRLAKHLGLTNQAVCAWRSGARQPDTLMCYRLAEILGMDPAQVIAHVELERAARSGRVDDVMRWSRYAERVTAVVSTVILSACMFLAPSGEAQASTRAQRGALDFQSAVDPLCIVAIAKGRKAGQFPYCLLRQLR